MKYVVVAKIVKVVDPRTGDPILHKNAVGEFVQFTFSAEDMLDAICSHPDLSQGGPSGMRRQQKLWQAFLGCKPGDVVGIEDADYDALCKVLNILRWSEPYARFASQFLPHTDALEAAAKQDSAWKKTRDEKEAAAENVRSIG